MSFFLDMYVLLKTSKTIIFGHERTRQTKPAPATKPRHTDVKTETLFSTPQLEPPPSKAVGRNAVSRPAPCLTFQ